MRINTKKMNREEWLKLRGSSIGGSESAALLGLDPYMSYYELYGIKTGLYEKPNIQNKFTVLGTMLEDTVANLWQYWENDMDTTIHNYEADLKLNKCQKLNAIVYHKKYPYLSANIDRVILSKERGRGVLEIKTISSWEAKKWVSGLPIKYLVQLQHYLLVTGYKWGQIAVLVMDTRELLVFEFERDEDIINSIVENSQNFWERVEKTKEAVANNESYEEFEPSVESTEAWRNFVTEFWDSKPESELTLNSSDLHRFLSDIEHYNGEIKEKEKLIIECENEVKGVMKENESLTVMDDSGTETLAVVSWKRDKRGARTFRYRLMK